MLDDSFKQLFQSPQLKCPTCKLTFHEQQFCRRCGTDLSLLMSTTHWANHFRNQAQLHLFHARYHEAIDHARKARSLQKTKKDSFLILLAQKAIQREENQ